MLIELGLQHYVVTPYENAGQAVIVPAVDVFKPSVQLLVLFQIRFFVLWQV